MARLRFRKPKIGVLMSEVITLTIWLFLGDEVIDALDTIVGTAYPVNQSGGALTDLSGCTNDSVFQDSYEILGIGYSCQDATFTTQTTAAELANSNDGLLGVIGLVMVVMVLMNFISYN